MNHGTNLLLVSCLSILGLIDDSHPALVSTGHALCVGTEGFAYHALALKRLLWTCGELFVGEAYVDGAVWYVDVDDVTVDNLSDVASGSSLRRDMSDG